MEHDQSAAVAGDPAWFPHRYDPDGDAVHYVPADRAVRAAATFLTDEYLPGAAGPVAVPLRAALAGMGAPAPLHFVFHSAYCCSTLLARALERPGLASALKEPVILNDLVGWRHRGAPPNRLGGVLDGALRLLSRPAGPGEAVVVKPSNVVNGLAPAMMLMRPDARAVLLHAPLDVFLASIARKGMWGRLWVRELLSKQLKEGMVRLGFETADYLLLTDLQAAAVGWLAQADLFARMCSQFGDRVRTLDSEVLVARPRDGVAAVTALFGLKPDAETLDAMAGEAFARNAKDGSAFTPGDRARERTDGAALHADEIEKVVTWAEAVARSAGVALHPPAPLLGG